jgi:hypothetical protein
MSGLVWFRVFAVFGCLVFGGVGVMFGFWIGSCLGVLAVLWAWVARTGCRSLSECGWLAGWFAGQAQYDSYIQQHRTPSQGPFCKTR